MVNYYFILLMRYTLVEPVAAMSNVDAANILKASIGPW